MIYSAFQIDHGGMVAINDLALLDDKRDQLLGKIQESYGLSKEDAENRFSELEKSCNDQASKAA